MNARRYTMDNRSKGVEDTRRAIIAAAGELFSTAWYEDVTLADLATGAGVSHQTVLNHFRSKEGVLAAVAEQYHADTASARDRVREGDHKGAVRVLVAEYERIGDLNVRASLLEQRFEAFREPMARARAWHRAWVERIFADLLPPDGPVRQVRLAAVLAAVDVATWQVLRRGYGFSRHQTIAAMTTLIDGLEATE